MADTLSLIRASLELMRNSERKVANCVLDDPVSVVSSSITELAERAGTSEPTVIRFCRRLGLRGYMDLRLSLARDLPSHSGVIFQDVEESDPVGVIAAKILAAHQRALSSAGSELDPEVISKAVELLAKARRIEFYGVGGSAIVARDAHHKFFRLGVPCIAYEDPHMQAMSAALLGAGDVVVAISHSGSTKDIIESVKIARGAGASVVGILGEAKSPLSRLCHVPITVHSREPALRLAPMTSRLLQLAVVDVLFVSMAMRQGEGITRRLDRVKRALVEKRF